MVEEVGVGIVHRKLMSALLHQLGEGEGDGDLEVPQAAEPSQKGMPWFRVPRSENDVLAFPRLVDTIGRLVVDE
jgi:hypothetical protein